MTGPTGPTGDVGRTGPAGSGSGDLLKFCCRVFPIFDLDPPGGNPPILSSQWFMDDSVQASSLHQDPFNRSQEGTGLGFNYINPSPRTFVSLAAKLLHAGDTDIPFFVPTGGLVQVQLFVDGIPVPGFQLDFTDIDPNLLTLSVAPPTFVAAGSTYVLRVTTFNFGSPPASTQSGFKVSATMGAI